MSAISTPTICRVCVGKEEEDPFQLQQHYLPVLTTSPFNIETAGKAIYGETCMHAAREQKKAEVEAVRFLRRT